MTTVEGRGRAGGAGVEAVAALPGLSHPAGCNNVRIRKEFCEQPEQLDIALKDIE